MAPHKPLSRAEIDTQPTDQFPRRFPRSKVQSRLSHRKNKLKLRSVGNTISSKGISLLHVPDLQIAEPGDTITFFTWIINDSKERMSHIRLIPRSFTNAGMIQLSYLSQPRPHELNFGPLLPSTTAACTFRYTATLDDQLHGGGIVSAMLVRATTSSGRLLWDECDALVDMHASTEPIAREMRAWEDLTSPQNASQEQTAEKSGYLIKMTNPYPLICRELP